MNIIITGAKGYLAGHFGARLQENHTVSYLSLRDEAWKRADFSRCDVIIHCAALVHQPSGEHSLEEYRKINVDLTRELAEKAKADGVKQFVFLSTRAVYGLQNSCFRPVAVEETTPLKPVTKYGITKLEAEKCLEALASDSFRVAVIRAPFVYGKDCRGNYPLLRKLVLKYRFVPLLPNQYSMLFVDNCSELVAEIVNRRASGLFLPQDLPLRGTSDLALEIAKCHGVKVCATPLFNPLIRIASLFVPKISAAFGNGIYREELSRCQGIDYHRVDFSEAVRRSEC